MEEKYNKNYLYLKSLRLSNFATFQQQEVHFNKTFNAIIGETGSGKSLLLDALQLIFGARADKKIIRKESEFAIAEAIFECKGIQINDYFEKIGHPYDGNEIVIKKIIYRTSTSKTYLNYQACSSNILSSFAKRFVDLVGQFENQKLLSENYQLLLLDSYADVGGKLKKYKEHFEILNKLKSHLEYLQNKKDESEKQRDFLKYQIDEIENASPSEEREKELIEKKSVLMNKERLTQVTTELIELISDSNDSATSLDLLNKSLSICAQNNDILSGDLIEKIHEGRALLEDISYQISAYLNDEYEEQDLSLILDELDQYQKLKRKYGTELKDVLKTFNKLKTEYQSFDQVDNEIDQTECQIEEENNHCWKLAQEIHLKRCEKAKKLSLELTKKIRSLNMSGATANFKLNERKELSTSGISQLDFLVETNPNEGMFKIKDVASGGELSRILLSLRSILAVNDTISIFLFDEIDTGMGGETALCIGKALKNVSNSSQVLAITHLPQIANYADKLIVVSKQQNKLKRTESLIKEVMGKERTKEIRAMTPLH